MAFNTECRKPQVCSVLFLCRLTHTDLCWSWDAGQYPLNVFWGHIHVVHCYKRITWAQCTERSVMAVMCSFQPWLHRLATFKTHFKMKKQVEDVLHGSDRKGTQADSLHAQLSTEGKRKERARKTCLHPPQKRTVKNLTCLCAGRPTTIQQSYVRYVTTLIVQACSIKALLKSSSCG